MVERVKISTTNFICKDASGNVTFDATRKYLKTTASGQGTVKLGGYRNCPVMAIRTSDGEGIGYFNFPNAGAFQCELYGLNNYRDDYGAAQAPHNGVVNGLTSQPMEYRFPFGMTNVFQPRSGIAAYNTSSWVAPYDGNTRIYGAATITGTTDTFPVSIYCFAFGGFTGYYGMSCVARIEDFAAAPIGQGVSATLYFPNLNDYSWRRTSDNADATSYTRAYAANGFWQLQVPTYLSGPPEDFDLTVTE